MDERDQNDDEHQFESRQEAHGRRRDSQQCHRRRRQERRQRALVYVAKVGMLAGHDVIHLVAVEAVCAGEHQEHGAHEPGNEEHGPRDREPSDTALIRDGRDRHGTRCHGKGLWHSASSATAGYRTASDR